MKRVLDWLEERTGAVTAWRRFWLAALPGGPRWRYAWSAVLLFTFLVQAITGFCLWTAYSPSTLTAWESVHRLEYELAGGWVVRGLHHFGAQAFVVLLALAVVQALVTGAYRAPREAAYLALVLLVPLAVALSVTGWLLPFDQRGLWAALVPLNLAGMAPGIGPWLQELALGGPQVGHATLTRFLALHAGLLPVCVLALLLLHLRLVRREFGPAPDPALAGVARPVARYWPDQFLREALACLGIALLLLAIVGMNRGTGLGAPADPSEQFAAARPEWFFLFLFEFLKHFPGGTEVIGAMIVPGAVFGLLLLAPWIARTPRGQAWNRAWAGLLVAGVGCLTLWAVWKDRHDAAFQAARAQAGRDAARAHALATRPEGVPPTGAAGLLRADALTQGPKLFARHCASCHRWDGHDGTGVVPAEPPSAADLKGFASRTWLAGLLDPARVATDHYFGGTKFKDGKMVRFVQRTVDGFDTNAQAQLRQVIAAVSAEAGLPAQRAAEVRDAAEIEAGRTLIAGKTMRCTECHQFRKPDEDATAPDLTGYGSRAWLQAFLDDPAHPRFYGRRNDRMPAFGTDRVLSPEEQGLIVDWLRGEWYEPPGGAR